MRDHDETPVGGEAGRLAQLRGSHPDEAAYVAHLLALAKEGLGAAYDPTTQSFAQTVRAVRDPSGVGVIAQGSNLRYTLIAGLGLACLDDAAQREVMAGTSAGELITRAAEVAQGSRDAGGVALAVWAMAEVNNEQATELLPRLRDLLLSGAPIPTVDLAWIVTALAVPGVREVEDTWEVATTRLLGAQGQRGIFPHHVPPSTQSRWRAHVGSFADQCYPVQALARGYRVSGDHELLEAANLTAARLCHLQGSAGQWWWHYDTRTGGVVERFPVYSVHQHAMAPMTMADLAAAGGADHLDEVAAGLRWLASPAETAETLVSDRFRLIWRKVGRREPRKAARAIRAVSTSLAPQLQTPGLDRLLPPGEVDHECRPYELGWMLYTWLSRVSCHG